MLPLKGTHDHTTHVHKPHSCVLTYTHTMHTHLHLSQNTYMHAYIIYTTQCSSLTPQGASQAVDEKHVEGDAQP